MSSACDIFYADTHACLVSKVQRTSKKKRFTKQTFHQKDQETGLQNKSSPKNILQENGLQNKPSPKKDPRAGIFFVFG